VRKRVETNVPQEIRSTSKLADVGLVTIDASTVNIHILDATWMRILLEPSETALVD